MSRTPRGSVPLAHARTVLRARLESRLHETEQAALTRAYAISDPTDADPLYRDGLRASISTALAYALEAIERGEERTAPPPPALLAQARLAARHGIGLDTVLRRYLAGYSILSELVIAEAGAAGLGGESLQQLLRGHAALFDCLLAAVTDEHSRESATRIASRQQRRTERISRLLAGEPLDTSEFEYAFDANHLALVANGPGADTIVRELARRHDCRLLTARPEQDTVWAWLGARRRHDPDDVAASLPAIDSGESSLSLGEPGEGLAGWRLTHRQAVAAHPIAQRGPDPVVRYADVALLAAALHDDLLATSLFEFYLVPLATEPDGGETLRQTLRAYFGCERNITSAASALGVSRRTVANRLRAVEARIECPLGPVMTDMELALRLKGLGELLDVGLPPVSSNPN